MDITYGGRSGVYCRQRMVNGIASSSVFHVGASMAYGGKFSVSFLKMLIYRMFLWMAQSLGRMPAAAGAANSSAENEALGRSKGGFGCKIHALCDAFISKAG